MTVSATPDWWSNGRLDTLRQVGDRHADAAVAVLAEVDAEPGMQSSLGFIERLVSSTEVSPTQRQTLKRFLGAAAAIPEWVDQAAITRAQQFFVRFATVHSTSLMLGGLLETYSNSEIARVLMRTGRLRSDAYRRLFETGSMVYDTMIPDCLMPGRRGYRTLLKVRLMHAGVRRLLLRSNTWDLAAYGMPIGQEDMAFTLLIFDVSTLRGAQRMGLEITPQQRQDHHHLWRYAGFLLGVDPSLLPAGAAEAEALHETIARRQRNDPSDGRALAAGLINAVAGRAPFFLPRPALLALCHRLIGPELSDHLGLRPAPPWRLAWRGSAPILGAIQSAETRSAAVGDSLYRIGMQWGIWALRQGLGDAPARFGVPGIMR
jgi:hypothetical protein